MRIWKVEWDDRARRELRRLDVGTQKRILRFTGERLAGAEDPRRLGRSLGPPLEGLWRYRIGDYRIVCNIDDNAVTVVILRLGHRDGIYRKR